MKSLAEFKRTLEPGMKLRCTFLYKGQIRTDITERQVLSSNTYGFNTVPLEGQAGSSSFMQYGSAKDWTFDNYIAGWSALWTDPQDNDYQVQYVYLEDGFQGTELFQTVAVMSYDSATDTLERVQ